MTHKHPVFYVLGNNFSTYTLAKKIIIFAMSIIFRPTLCQLSAWTFPVDIAFAVQKPENQVLSMKLIFRNA